VQSPRRLTQHIASIAIGAVVMLGGCTAAATSAPATAAPTATAAPSAVPSAAAPVSKGAFHKVDGTATGSVFLFHKPDGSFVITFEDFAIDSIAHTNVILVTNKDVTKDGDIDKTALVDLGPLKGASGMQDFTVPATADAMTLHTVVLWDTEMAHAIAAAPLQ
jgi:hypothetical protein